MPVQANPIIAANLYAIIFIPNRNLIRSRPNQAPPELELKLEPALLSSVDLFVIGPCRSHLIPLVWLMVL
jgi:hypothetical protein